jgi:formate hydrogenlyase subunit 3/multisubunit Na+/H+ antiporter MnhD subunit
MKKYIFIAMSFVGLLAYQKAMAVVCPVCTIAICAGVGLSRWLKIDDTISGIWIGGLIVAMTMWLLLWLSQKNIKFKYQKTIISLATYLVVILPLYFTNIMGHPDNRILGIDKILFGIIVGSIVLLASLYSYDYLKKKNNGKPNFPFQKVAMPFASLLAASLILFFIICS